MAGKQYILKPAPILTTAQREIKIEKVKARKKVNNRIEVVEIPPNDLEHAIIRIQMRTVAQNGMVSLPPPKYIIELIPPMSLQAPPLSLREA